MRRSPMRPGLYVALAGLLAVASTLATHEARAGGFFRTKQIDGVWWLIAPDGTKFFSKGVNVVSYAGDYSPPLRHSPYQRNAEAKYASADKWAEATAARLGRLGFNTIGPWSSPEMLRRGMPYALMVGIARSAGADWQTGKIADVFAPSFAKAAREHARKVCAAHARDAMLLGYFTDNELRWGRDWRGRSSLLEEFMNAPPGTPGREAAVRVLRARYPTVESFNRAWGTDLPRLENLSDIKALPMTSEAAQASARAFLREYARTYFKVAREAIRAVDPNHMILGVRFAGQVVPEVAETMGEFVDIASLNSYTHSAPMRRLEQLHATTKRPVLLSEFSFTARDAGLPNVNSGATPLATQQERAELYRQHVERLAAAPYVVGFHWFQWCDQPASGRPDGSSSNFGIVKIDDEPWPALAAAMQEVNPRLEEIHAKAGAGRVTSRRKTSASSKPHPANRAR